MRNTILTALFVVAMGMSTASAVHAQDRDARPLRMIVASAPGSAPDLIARLLGEELQTRLGRSVVIENKAGAGGILGVQAVKDAKPDGNTILFAQAAAVAVTPLTYKAAKYDMEQDFEAVSVVADAPLLFVTNPTSGIRTLAEAIERAKSNPGSVAVGSTARGSIPHLAVELLKQNSRAAFREVPMSNAGQALQAVVSGDTPLSVNGAAPLLPMVKAGRIKAVALTSNRKLPGFEDIPLANETIPGLTVTGWYMVFAPKGTSMATLQQLNAAIDAGVRAPSVIEKMLPSATFPVGGSLDDAKNFLVAEKKRWADVIKRAGIEAE